MDENERFSKIEARLDAIEKLIEAVKDKPDSLIHICHGLRICDLEKLIGADFNPDKVTASIYQRLHALESNQQIHLERIYALETEHTVDAIDRLTSIVDMYLSEIKEIIMDAKQSNDQGQIRASIIQRLDTLDKQNNALIMDIQIMKNLIDGITQKIGFEPKPAQPQG